MKNRTLRLGEKLKKADSAEDIDCLVYALFRRSDFCWKDGRLTSARIPTKKQDKAIFEFHKDGIFLQPIDGSGSSMAIAHEDSAEEMAEIANQVEQLAAELFEGFSPEEHIVFMPACGMGKLPWSLETHEVLAYTCLYFHLLKRCQEKFFVLKAFSDHLNFNPEEYLSALLFYLLYKMEAEDSTFEYEAGWALQALPVTGLPCS